MFRKSVLTFGLMLLLLMPPPHAIGYEMEGLLDLGDIARRGTTTDIATEGSGLSVDATAARELPDPWDCTKPEGVVQLHDVALCRVMGEAAPAARNIRLTSATGAATGAVNGAVNGAARVIGALAATETSEATGATRTVIRYRILIEQGLEHLADLFVPRVGQILNGPGGWAGNKLSFVRVSDDFKFTVLLARPKSVDRLCRPLRTGGWLSCAIRGRAVINADRWQGGAKTWGGNIAGYHSYLINHEVGHVLGLGHINCPQAGAPAPIMLPQTRFLKGCMANGAATPQDLAKFERLIPRLKQRLAGTGNLMTYQSRKRRFRRSRRSRRASYRRANYKRSGYRRSRNRRRRRAR
jgi:hypothetical protein